MKNWEFVRACLEKLKFSNPELSLKFQICMLDPKWEELPTFNENWPAFTSSFGGEVKEYCEEMGWKNEPRFYQSSPMIYGMMFDREVVFKGTMYWKQKPDGRAVLVGGDNSLTIYDASSSKFESNVVDEFAGWFEHFYNFEPKGKE